MAFKDFLQSFSGIGVIARVLAFKTGLKIYYRLSSKYFGINIKMGDRSAKVKGFAKVRNHGSIEKGL